MHEACRCAEETMLQTLLLNPPSYEGFDGGAGARYQARREIRSFWYPTWLAQPAAIIPGCKLVDAPPHGIGVDEALDLATGYELVVVHTSTPTIQSNMRFAEALKARRPEALIGFVGAHAAVLPQQTLRACPAVDFVARKEFDFTLAEVAEGRPLAEIDGISYWDRERGVVVHRPERSLIANMDSLPFVVNVYKRDLTIENYYIGYLRHPYVSLY